ncbi:MAG: thiamine pyrophosphate-binding protein, partial [Candidatus Dormibacteraeota bacterium]|nr:thiamine pyrophosphate-binding protein [Candidatus Dormibacteraeota bacterium]
AESARALVAELRGRGQRRTGRRTPDVEQRIRTGSWRDEAYEDAGTADHIDPRTLSIAVDRLLPRERTVAVDSGHLVGWPPMYLRVPDAQGFVFTQALQAVGLGLASAIGAAVARPDRLTVAALGDGGALMGLSELETVARLGLRMVILVYDDAAYGAEVHHFAAEGAEVDLVRFPDTDFAALARAAGLDGITVRSEADLTRLRDWLERPERPAMLIDAKVVEGVVAQFLEDAFGH